MAACVIESDKSFLPIAEMSSFVDRPEPARHTFQDTLSGLRAHHSGGRQAESGQNQSYCRTANGMERAPGLSAMAEDAERGGVDTMKAALWASAGLVVGAFYLGYYCAKFFFLP